MQSSTPDILGGGGGGDHEGNEKRKAGGGGGLAEIFSNSINLPEFKEIEGGGGGGGRKLSKVGLVLAGLMGGSAVLLTAICYPFLSPGFRRVCLPYVPATTNQVSNVLRALEGRGGSLIDLGSGDGRIVFAAAQKGFESKGVELNPWLVWYSKFQARRLGLSTLCSFHRQDIWWTPLHPYGNVVIFGVESMMSQLEFKCRAELQNGAVVVACRFPFPNSPPDREFGEGLDRIWVYEKRR